MPFSNLTLHMFRLPFSAYTFLVVTYNLRKLRLKTLTPFTMWFTFLMIMATTTNMQVTAENDPFRKLAGSTCSVDFNYVSNFPASHQLCEKNKTICCSALLNLFAIGLSEYLQTDGIFEFRDLDTATSCVAAYQQALSRNGVTTNFRNDCHTDMSMFVQSPECAGIRNLSDWNRIVGPHAMDNACRGDLTKDSDCQTCTTEVSEVTVRLQKSSPNLKSQQCVYIACLYAAGKINRFGPRNPSTAACLLGVDLSLTTKQAEKHVGLYVGLGLGVPLAVIILVGALLYKLYRRRARKAGSLLPKGVASHHLRIPNIGMIQFNYNELQLGTQNFNEKNFIGEGGYGRVYRGILPSYDNMEVAVKVMKESSPESSAEFLNEVAVINTIRHRNLVQVRGGCVFVDSHGEHQRILVYDYMPNGCLEDYLSKGTKPLLSWPERRKIAVGMAVGINYLHNEVQPSIIHRDIKPSNILLDENFEARVADFGLAKMAEDGMTHLTTRVAGTPLYMAVEYALYGQCSEKVDVYSFGIVLLELMSGRKALDTTQGNPMHYHIVDWAWNLVKEGRTQAIIDENIRNSGPVSVMERFVLVGILCAHLLVAFRPPIGQALKMLEGDEDIPEIPDRPTPYIWANLDNTTFDISQGSPSTRVTDELLR